jgi:hypothetical protein
MVGTVRIRERGSRDNDNPARRETRIVMALAPACRRRKSSTRISAAFLA